MKIFLSYPHTHKSLAEDVAARLSAAGHDLFWDHLDLPAGQEFDDSISEGIKSCDLFLAIVTPESHKAGKYALTELSFVQQKWRNPSGRVLPILVDGASPEDMPAYLRSVTALTPRGNATAEIVAAASRLRASRRPNLALLAVPLLVTIAGLALWFWPKDQSHDIQFSASLSGEQYKIVTDGPTRKLIPNTEYFQALADDTASGTPPYGTELYFAIGEDRQFVFPPEMKLNLVNQSDKTRLIDSIRLNVRKSVPNLSPLLSVTSRPTNCPLHGAIAVRNDGWGDAQELLMDFRLSNGDYLEQTNWSSAKFLARKELVDISPGGQIVIPLWEEIAMLSGADPAPIQILDAIEMENNPDVIITTFPNGKRQVVDGPFKTRLEEIKAGLNVGVDDKVYIEAKLHYLGAQGDPKSFFFREPVHLLPVAGCIASPIAGDATYQIELRSEGVDYVLTKDISHELKAGEAEVIKLTLFTEQSASHEMTADIRIDGNWVSAKDVLNLEYYRPFGSDWGP